MDDYKLDQQMMTEMTEVLRRHLPNRLVGSFDEFELVSLDILCSVKEGERLNNITVFFSTSTLKQNGRA